MKKFFFVFGLVIIGILIIPFILGYFALMLLLHFVNFTGVKTLTSPIKIHHYTDKFDYEIHHSANILIENEGKDITVLVDKRNLPTYVSKKIICYKKGRINQKIWIV